MSPNPAALERFLNPKFSAVVSSGGETTYPDWWTTKAKPRPGKFCAAPPYVAFCLKFKIT